MPGNEPAMDKTLVAQYTIRSSVLKKSKRFIASQDWQLYALLFLPMLYFLIFKYIPMYGVTIAFKEFNMFQGVWKSPWVGLDAFREIFLMKDFYKVLRNTVLLNLLDLLVSFPAPIVLAVLLNEIRIKWFKKGAQTILYLPHFISWVIIGGMVYQLLSTNTGLVNILLKSSGVKAIPFLTEPVYWVITYVGSGVWQNAGWGTIIYLAALAGINKELYEAAEVDGAGRLRKIWNITLPGIKPTIMILLIINIGHMASIGFERPFVLGNPLVTDVSDVISTFVYKVGVQSARFTIATAIGLFQAVVGLIFLLSSNYISKKVTDQGIW
ncbi:sugar ABC transporter permease [Paenibacillus sp. CGMCC 1.16610]|uniref:ABC transporter permease subunit n=3 Tax=Paenibacillus TaxID=44249 RepID=A0ABU6DCT0_9BACL|nr:MULTISPECIES: ABC transporter permease subunit [Paenibacillus]MBA2939132.1 sugar ABC transporter permease [Paenibacillus sp. CGMCC 1.16610]MCY9662949.1 ABC transporter permease subunit [Paenibacillus anseongense]MEB4795570.1 ABC transporter permease subunit [Paenibacillus chondroitinus]MVQ35091.1 ABC transporter permease subunit [Paenibacillus anseongense]